MNEKKIKMPRKGGVYKIQDGKAVQIEGPGMERKKSRTEKLKPDVLSPSQIKKGA